MVKKDQELIDSINKLNSSLEKRNSFFRNFLLGILTGLGSAIGAILIGGILITLIVSNLDFLEQIPVLRNVITVEQVEEVIVD